MGDRSTTCAVSGLPISRHGQKIVGIRLERYRWHKSYDGYGRKNQWIPKAMPSFGGYDQSFGIEEDGDDLFIGDYALIHQDIWDNAYAYWHKENREFDKNWLDWKRALETARKEAKSSRKVLPEHYKGWKMTDFLFDKLKDQFQKSDVGLVFRELIDSTREIRRKIGKRNTSWLGRSKFMESILKKMVKGEWTEQDQENLNKMICLFCGQMQFGRFIQPALRSPIVSQYSDVTQQIGLLEAQLATAKKLQAEMTKSDDE